MAVIIIYFISKKPEAKQLPKKKILVNLSTARMIQKINAGIGSDNVINNKPANVFENNTGENFENLSFLTPEEAEDELRWRKAGGEYLSKEEYWGYIDRIASKNDDKHTEQLSKMSPEEALSWFRRKRLLKERLSTNIWNYVTYKVAPMHEPILLEMLKKINPSKVERWVKTKKKEGFFFTDRIYTAAKEKSQREQAIYYQPKGEDERKKIDSIKRSLRRYRQKIKEYPGEEKYKKLYNNYVEAYEILTGENYKPPDAI